ncbi:unnamed protein product [Auanema sp. JU1783]|nr:unnamed protein product [Auanema sp. JU1783]
MLNRTVIKAICNGSQPWPTGLPITECEQYLTGLTESTMDDSYSFSTRILMTFIFSVLSLIGVIGNILVITVVFKVKGMKTPTNCYLVSLAVSDLLFFVATAPTELSYLHVDSGEYIFGSVGCALFSYLPYLAINSSSLSITAFTIERFIGICYPYQARSICTVSRACLIIFCIWVFSIIYNSPWLYLASIAEDSEGTYCNFKLDRDNWTYKTMFLMDFAVFYMIPMLLNIIIYGRIAMTLSQCGDKLKQSVKQCKNTEISPICDNNMEYHVSGRRSTIKGKNQVVKMLALVVVVFATCWLPYRAMVMYNSFAENRWNPDWYIFFSKTMIFINCAINPILYHLMSARFREAFQTLFRREKKNVANRTCSVTIPTKVLVSQKEQKITRTSPEMQLIMDADGSSEEEHPN